MFIYPKGRQENGRGQVKRSKPDQSLGGTVWLAGLWSRQAEWSGRQGSKPGGLEKENGKSRRMGKTLFDLETYKTNWHRETGNTGINTLGRISDTWRGWRQ